MLTDSVCLAAHAVVTGEGTGSALVLCAPLSFWGGLDSQTGTIIEHGHADRGQSVAGKVLFMSRAKGSSSSSSVLAEAIRNGTGPTAIVMQTDDLIVGLGCIIASELYGVHVPIIRLSEDAWTTALAKGKHAVWLVHADAEGATLRCK